MARITIKITQALSHFLGFLGVILDLWDVYRTVTGGIVLAASGGWTASTKLPWWYATLLGIGIFLVATVGIVLLLFKFKQRGEQKYAKLPSILRDMNATMADEASKQAQRFKKNPQMLDKFGNFMTQWARLTNSEKQLLQKKIPLGITKEWKLGSKWYRNMHTNPLEIITSLPKICERTGIVLDTLEHKSLRYALLWRQLYDLTPLPLQFSKEVNGYLSLCLIEHTWDMLEKGGADYILETCSPNITILNMQISDYLKELAKQQLETISDKINTYLKPPQKSKENKQNDKV